MADRRKETPDILGDLLGSKPAGQDTSKTERQDTSKTVTQHTGKPIKKKRSRKVARKPPEPPKTSADEERVKATYYLSQTALEGLDEAWLKLRRMARSRKISKSLIVETATLLAVEELETKGKKSQLASKLVNQ